MRLFVALLTVSLVVVGAEFNPSQKLAAAEPNGQGTAAAELGRGLVGHWKLQGDVQDSSGKGHDAVNHGADLKNGTFEGSKGYVEVPASDSLKLGSGDFTISAWVHLDKVIDDVVGDVFSWYDPQTRRGMTLNIKSSSGGYQSQGDDRHVYFGIDNGKLGEWEDNGRPNATSNYVSNSLTVFNGDLYCATIDGATEADWGHVYKYAGGKKWIDCGRVGNHKSTGVMGLIVHQGHLYAGTNTYDWTRVFSGKFEPSHVYRFEGGTKWTDCGQIETMLRLNCMASFGGKLYCGGDRGVPPPGEKQFKGRPYKVYVYEGGTKWSVAGSFPPDPPTSLYPHAMCVHDGQLFVGYPNVFRFDGKKWVFAGTPLGKTPESMIPYLQVHSLEVFRGKLVAGMWPDARVVEYAGDKKWEDRGMLGDGTEINALTLYNGKLYGGAIPRGEVSRYDDAAGWTSLKRFYSPQGWDPGTATGAVRDQLKAWTRVTSLTCFKGRLYASIGSCTSSAEDAPLGVRGSVYSVKAGESATYEKDLGHGWKHLTALRQGGELRLYVDGKLVSKSDPFKSADYDLTTKQPLKIGFGEQDYFSGKIRDVRLYQRALSDGEVEVVHSADKP